MNEAAKFENTEKSMDANNVKELLYVEEFNNQPLCVSTRLGRFA